MSIIDVKCPNCGSVNTKNISKDRDKYKTYTCKNCEHTWVVKKDSFF